jgi:alkanesulfonate monooxygenase SsuD/methylene tetrahydromethanopterin reductase-like flavin-dependent oxidoreductase (luciferase family)
LDAGRAQFQRVRDACAAAGRDPETMTLSAALATCCGRDAAEVERRAKAIGRPPANIDLAGTPAEIVDKLGQWQEAGATRAYLQLLDLTDLDHVRLLAEEVMPQVQ